MPKRNANLDVFRCLSMFLIVLSHVYNHGVYYLSSKWISLVFNLLIIWHVDAFLALSGWFGMRFSMRKFLNLWGVIAFYSVVSIAVGRIIMGESTRLMLDGGWFGNTYLCLLLVVPFVNAAIENLVSRGKRAAWLVWSGFAAVVLINWISRNHYFGILAQDVVSYSLAQMIFIYVTVRLLRLTEFSEHVKIWHLCCMFGLFLLGILLLGNNWRTDYMAPYVIGMAIAMLLLFEKFVRVPQWLGRVCVWAAPSMFGVYLLHEVSSYGKLFHRVPGQYLTDHFALPPALVIFLSAAVCFLLCLLLDVARRYSLMGVKALCAKVLKH